MFKREALEFLSPSSLENGPIYPWYSSTYINSASLPPGAQLGAVWGIKGPTQAGGGNQFMWIKADVALAEGQVVSPGTPTAGTYTSAGSTVQVLNTNITTTLANDEVGNFIFFLGVTAGGAATYLRVIKANTAGANASFTVSLADPMTPGGLADADALAALPTTNGTACCIYRPYHGIVCTASLMPIGIALGTVTQYYYTIVQVAGMVKVQAVGNGTATVVNVPAITSAAGVIIGGGATASLYLGAGSIVPKLAYSGAGVALIPCDVNLLGNI